MVALALTARGPFFLGNTLSMRIGISVITHPGQNIWENGMGQNVLFLASLLQRIEFVEQVVLLEVGEQGAMPPQVDIEAMGLTLVRFSEATFSVDVVIELSGALSPEWLDRVRACGTRVVYHCVGQPYVGLVEPLVFTDKGSHHRYERCDEVWMLPKDAAYAPMVRTLHRCPVHEVPYIWSPRFLAPRAAELEALGSRFGYAPSTGGAQPWRVAIFEPNISVVKTSLVPMLICDEAFRADPTSIGFMNVLNSEHMAQHPSLLYLGNALDLVREKKAVFLGRHDFVGFMAQNGDAVVAHQWANAQNYSYLDALYGGYPLIHNSPWLKDAGYYYPAFDIAAGAAQLMHAARTHDASLDTYRASAQRVFDAVDPHRPANLEAYAQRLLQLVGGDPAFRADGVTN